MTAPARGFPWYVAGVGTWFGGFGMQQVLFSWLVVGELHAEARWVGVAQSASMIPSFLLILLGGALADRRDRRAC
jgi:MFS family permease